MSMLVQVPHGNGLRNIVTIPSQTKGQPRRNVCVEIGYSGDTVSAYHYPHTCIAHAVDDANARHPKGRIISVYEYQ